jgi:hypothetical protein
MSLLILAIAGCSSPRPARLAAAVPSDPLLELNRTARASYRSERERLIASAGPLLILEGEKIVFLHHGRREERNRLPQAYHDLKTFDHLALALESLLGAETLDTTRLASLRDVRDRIDPALREFEKRGYPADAVLRARAIAARVSTVIDGAIRTGKIDHADYVQFARTLSPLLLAGIADAAKAELDAIHRHVSEFRKSMPERDWERVHVIVMGPHMAREQSLESQYFQRLLGDPTEGNRIIYAEAVADETKAIDLLGTHMLDARIAESFFGDPMRLHRDALSDAAAEYVRVLLP